MKKIIITSIIIAAAIFTYSQDKAYMQAMGKNLQEMAQAETLADFQSLANNFERIAEASPKEWLPGYYAAYCYMQMVFSSEGVEDIDQSLDKAESFLEKARDISPENAEIEVLQGWLYQGRIQADPMGRGMEYSQKASAAFGKAKGFDPENPRVYFLLGQNILYTPEAFGGGMEAACPYFREAKEKFDNFEPETPISPDWGKEYNETLVEDCK